ncbi:cell division protein FtsL [Thermithiobacillus plumbiphilus]|uniref:Cell division protein FtsL n=1 Tax=Thermithiobacillus plumbiphilus TaxID=1729899 RepID=A0ABU9D5U7_9PROT
MRALPFLLAGLILVSLIGLVAVRQTSRDLFINLQSAQHQRFKMETQWGQLQLEQSTLAAHGRIDEIARDKLQMRMPPVNGILVVRQP